MKRVTDLNGLRHGLPFTWGELVAIHGIGKYDIVEYHPWLLEDPQSGSGKLLVGQPDKHISRFHCYIDGKDQGHATHSLDSALATCIAIKHEGRNTRAGHYFIKMIKGEDNG